MQNIYFLIILFLFIWPNYSEMLTSSISLKIDILSLKKCDSASYPVEISNVTVEIDEGKLVLSGILSTAIQLDAPVKGILTVERDEWGAWIKLPCVDQLGSCTYDDLCIHSIPANNSCPRQFIVNKVPCRCPIPKGTYIIRPSITLPLESHGFSSVYTGKYWAKAFLLHKESNLACYEVYFNIRDKADEATSFVPGDYNEIEPFVELVR